MSFQPPANFGERYTNLMRCLDRLDAARGSREQDDLQREALTIACKLLSSVDEAGLAKDLGTLLGPINSNPRQSAAAILQREDLFRLFLMMEEELFKRAAPTLQSHARVVSLLQSVRGHAIAQIQTVTVEQIIGDFREVRAAVCALKDKAVEHAREEERDRLRDERDTRILNAVGSTAIILDTALVCAGVASLIFLPVMSIAGCAASAALGGVAQSQRKK